MKCCFALERAAREELFFHVTWNALVLIPPLSYSFYWPIWQLLKWPAVEQAEFRSRVNMHSHAFALLCGCWIYSCDSWVDLSANPQFIVLPKGVYSKWGQHKFSWLSKTLSFLSLTFSCKTKLRLLQNLLPSVSWLWLISGRETRS